MDAAAALIVRYGYDKTTMNDIADEAGVTRAIAYIHFKNKDALLNALLYRETQQYMQAWLDDFESNPGNGTISGVFRSSLHAVNRSPFLSAMMKQDQRVFGGYLRKPGNLFESIQIGSIWVETLGLLRSAGAIRAEVDPALFSYIMNALSLGLVTMQGDKKFGDPPPFDDLMTAIAEMLDRTLAPADSANQEAGRAILRQMALAVKSNFEHSQPGGTMNAKSKITLTKEQETLLIPLFAKAQNNPVLADENARRVLDGVEYDFARLKVPEKTAVTLRIRAKQLDAYTRQFIAAHPNAIILHLGCGLDSRCLRVQHPEALWFDLDLPDVIELRREFFSETENYHMIASSVTDLAWIEQIPADGRPVICNRRRAVDVPARIRGARPDPVPARTISGLRIGL